MFESVIGHLRQTQSEFDSKIKDSFGKSIDERVFEPAGIELEKLEFASNEAEMKMREVNLITLELRGIV